MKELTIIVPLVEYRDELNKLFTRSINSVTYQDKEEVVPMIFIGPTSSINYIKDNFNFGERDVLFIENNKNIELQFQVNKAVKDVKTKYFTVLEFDDAFTHIWFNNVETYINAIENVSLFLPLTEVFDEKHPELGGVGYVNEPVWSASFSEEMGYLDTGALKNYYNFNVTGGVFNKADYLSVGGLKNNIKVFFWYELLLRMTHNDKKVYVIPKVGYEHYVNVDNSLSYQFSQMEQKELDFWFDAAGSEYIYKTDRKKSYTADSE